MCIGCTFEVDVNFCLVDRNRSWYTFGCMYTECTSDLCVFRERDAKRRFWLTTRAHEKCLLSESPSQVTNYSPGYMGQAPSRGHEASPQSGLGVGCRQCPSSNELRGLSARAQGCL